VYLIQCFLPLQDNDKNRFPREMYDEESQVLTRRFGGLTRYARAPADGVWDGRGKAARDELIIYEVMADALDREWWQQHRRDLERCFRQESIVIRAHMIESL
jgi:hypothetical protein